MVDQIELTQGKVAIIDKANYHELSKHKWSFDGRYAATYQTIGGKLKKIYMHRFILNVLPGFFIDHANADKLDNRISNLRLCTKSLNGANKKKSKGTLKKGVVFMKLVGNFQASITVQKKRIYLGVFKTEIEAHNAYIIASKKYFGEFARTE